MILPPRLLVVALLLAGCGTTTLAGNATLTGAAPSSPVPADLAGHQYDQPDADHVLLAGESLVVTLPTGTMRVTVGGPALVRAPALVAVKAAQRHPFLATFTITATVLTGTARLSPTEFRLLAIADQVNGATRVTTLAKTTTLVQQLLTKGKTVTATWTAPFLEGHGEFLLQLPGAARPVALWDFRAEA